MSCAGSEHGLVVCLLAALSAVSCVASAEAPSIEPSGSTAPAVVGSTRSDGQPPSESPFAVTGLRRQRYDDGSFTLFIDYQAPGPSDDPAGLADEATRVWSLYRDSPDALDASRIITQRQAVGHPESTLLFPFYRRVDGTWDRPHVRPLPGGQRVVLVSTRISGDSQFVDYLTSLPMTDYCPLAKEVSAVWDLLRPEVEGSIATVFILPTDAPIVGSTISYSFGRSAAGWKPRGFCIKEALSAGPPSVP